LVYSISLVRSCAERESALNANCVFKEAMVAMKRVIKLFESGLAVGILAVLFIVLVAAFIDIAYEIYQNILAPPILIVDASGLMSLFSLVLVLLIGLELTETVKAYLDDDVVHVDLVVLVAIIAIARKVIVWDIEKYSYIDLFSLAAMTLALGVTYFLIKRAEASSGEQGTRGNPKQALS
jgi:uncharacterized membrane protein (DUF373 family)